MGTLSQKTVTVKVRAGKINPTTQVVTWGGWTTYTYVYKKEAVVAGALETWSVANSDDTAKPGKMITGTAHAGQDAVSYSVELDYKGDGDADGIAIPGADGTFKFYVTPGKTAVRARLVETIVVGSTTARQEGAWQSVNYTGTLADAGKADLVIDITGTTTKTIAGVKVDNYKSGSSLSLAIDVDGDGVSDTSVTVGSDGKVSMASILTAMRQSSLASKVYSGLMMPTFWLTGTTVHTDTKVSFPVINDTGLTTAEKQGYQTKQNEFASNYAAYTSALAQVNQTSYVETQYYNGTVIDTGGTQGATNNSNTNGTGSLNTLALGATQADLWKLQNGPVPTIQPPNLTGDLVDFANDPGVKDAIAAANRSYEKAVLNLQKQAQTQYNSLLATCERDLAVLKAGYDATVAQNEAKAQAMVEKEFETTEEYKQIVAAATAQLNAALAAYNVQIAGASNSAERESITYQYTLQRVGIESQRDNAIASARFAYLTRPESVLAKKAALANLNIDAKETFDLACSARETQFNGAVNQLDYDTNQSVTDAGTAGNTSVNNAIQAAVDYWAGVSGGDPGWISYIRQCIAHMITRINADNAAYRVNAKAHATAGKALGDAIIAAAKTARDASIAAAKAASTAAVNNYRSFAQEALAVERDFRLAQIANDKNNRIATSALKNDYTSSYSKSYSEYQISRDVEAFYADLETFDQIYSRGINDQRKSYNDAIATDTYTRDSGSIACVAGYLNGSTNIGANYSISLLNVSESYEHSTVSASSGYNSSVIGADATLQTALVNNALTQNLTDLSSEKSYLDAKETTYYNSIIAWANGLGGAYGDYMKANASAGLSHFGSILDAAAGFVSSCMNKGAAEATSGISILAGLAGGTASAIGSFLSGWIDTSYGGDIGFVDADRKLSVDNTNKAKDYLIELARIEKERALDINRLKHETAATRMGLETGFNASNVNMGQTESSPGTSPRRGSCCRSRNRVTPARLTLWSVRI